MSSIPTSHHSHPAHHALQHNSLYSDIPMTADSSSHTASFGTFSMASKLGIPIVNLAPDIEHEPVIEYPKIPVPSVEVENVSREPKKKKYAKEAWPGKRPTHSLLV